jgi:hypothetical protein
MARAGDVVGVTHPARASRLVTAIDAAFARLCSLQFVVVVRRTKATTGCSLTAVLNGAQTRRSRLGSHCVPPIRDATPRAMAVAPRHFHIPFYQICTQEAA